MRSGGDDMTELNFKGKEFVSWPVATNRDAAKLWSLL
jgi:hypothetical protein